MAVPQEPPAVTFVRLRVFEERATPMQNWWKRGVIYQIYPRSLQDTDSDGIGDLRGIRTRLGYLADLGVDAIWLSPVYPSPMKDFGYDVSNYTDVHPMFGTLAELDRLIEDVKSRGLKLILDFVPNHTSNAHPWFVESRSSRNNPHRDWYLWRDPAPGGGPPNNWLSQFGGSAWELDERTGQYYYHAFLKEQPDLNWRNPQVVAAMHEVLRFWLRRGVDGFRVDVLWHLIKDDQFRDNPPNPAWRGIGPPHHSQVPLYTTDRPEIHDIVSGLRAVANEFDHRVLIGEIYLPLERLVAYYGTELNGVHLPFNFQLLQSSWHARDIAKLIDQYEGLLPGEGWPTWVLGNHDNPRVATRVGIDQARVAAMLLLTLRGTPTMYYGDELGMQDVRIPRERVQDPFEKNVPGIGVGRDPCRTPMQWDASANAGFSIVEPWLPVADNYTEINVESESDDPASMLSLYRKLLQLRRKHAALSLGGYQPVATTGDLLAYIRKDGNERFLVALNLGGEPHSLSVAVLGFAGSTVLSTYMDRENEPETTDFGLRAHEGIIVRLS
jgi:alpha-glucosidase